MTTNDLAKALGAALDACTRPGCSPTPASDKALGDVILLARELVKAVLPPDKVHTVGGKPIGPEGVPWTSTT